MQLAVTASGDGVLTYQWQKKNGRNWENLSGETDSSFTIKRYDPSLAGDYRCEVSNGATIAYSKDATIETWTTPELKTHPRSSNLNAGGNYTLKSSAMGYPTPKYQWQKLGTDGKTWEDIPKAVRAELRLIKLNKNHSGQYRVIASNSGGSSTSDTAEIKVYYAPILTTDLESKTFVNENNDTTLSISAEMLDSKGSKATYTWYKDKKTLKDGGTISGAKTATLKIRNATAVDTGSYWCIIKNGVGSTSSRTTKMTVILKPIASKPLTSLDLQEGKTATFSASIKGGKPLSYQWQKDGIDLDDQTKNKLSLRGVKPSDAGTYKLIVINPAGTLEMEANLAVTAVSSVVVGAADFNQHEEESSPTSVLRQALGSNSITGQTYLPQADTIEDGDGNNYVSFSYTESKYANDISYIVERSTDLKTWTPVDMANTSVSRLDRGDFTEVTLYFPADDGDGFFRVRIEK